MIIIEKIAWIWVSISGFFYYLAYYAEDIPFVGDFLHNYFESLQHIFYEEDRDGAPMETCLYARTIEFGEVIANILDKLGDILSWSNIKKLIRGFWPGLDDAIAWFDNLVTEFKTFAADPVKWSKDKFKSTILPWALDNIPWLATIYKWYDDFKDELELFFDDPTKYLKDKFRDDILPWAIANIPFISWIYAFYLNFKGEVEVFFNDPIKWLRDKFENDVLPWAKQNIPFFSTLYKWYEDAEVDKFLTDPLQWLYDKMDEWFERFW